MIRLTNLLVLRETDKAIQVKQEIKDREPVTEWFPKSVCAIKRYPKDHKVDLSVEDWFFEEKSKMIEK